ncbi:MAG: hypothetical protein ACYS99_20950, partial [Planctomycetota bacterium]
MPAKKIAALAVVLTLALATSSRAGDRSAGDLREELTALTRAITAQAQLLELYEQQGKHAEAAKARARILELVGKQRRVLDELITAIGGKPHVPPLDEPEDADLPGASGKFAPPPKRIPPGEAAKLALAWLAEHQDRAGHWDCDAFSKSCDHTPCSGAGNPQYDPGVTGLSLLAFLGAGETHRSGEYKSVVKNALQYLKQIQDPEGCFG